MIEPWIQTYSGQALDLLNPQPEQINLEDIAHALARVCRYGGHSRRFYSVAEHSCYVMRELQNAGCSEPTVRWGLMHDAAEAYVGDMLAPLKAIPGLEFFRFVELRIQNAIARRFDLPPEIPPAVKLMDLRMLATEKAQVFGPEPRPWNLPDDADPLPVVLGFWDPDRAERYFLGTAERLGVRS